MKTTELLLDTGLVQFGRFQEADGVYPFRLFLDYLPAYPDVLGHIATLANSFIHEAKIDRLIAMPAALPLGVALSLKTGVSLVYSRGQGEAAAYDLVGTYNAGDTGLILTTVLGEKSLPKSFLNNIKLVGLNVNSILALIDVSGDKTPAGFSVQSIFRLADLVNEWADEGRLPLKQSEAVQNWISERQVNPHPNATTP